MDFTVNAESSCSSPVVCKSDDGAVVFVATAVVLHASVNNTTDRLVNVVRTNVLQEVDHLLPGRLHHIQIHTQFHIHQYSSHATDTAKQAICPILKDNKMFYF